MSTENIGAGSRARSPIFVRRFWAHVTRSRARIGLFVAIICTLLYALIPDFISNQTIADPFRQFVLILAGVAASAVFLPELSADLWTLTRERVRRLIPENERANLSRTLVAAESHDDEWNALVYDQALAPLLVASRDPSQVVWNMTYSVQAHLNQTAQVGASTLGLHSMETISRSERVLPSVGADGTYWISVARTEIALHSEFGERACLAREVVSLEDQSGKELTGEAWREAILKLCSVSVTINGEVQEARPDPAVEGEADLVRWKLRPEAAEIDHRIPVYIAFDFPIRDSEDRFPVYFSGYYCAGATVVAMKVFGLKADTVLHCDTFFARGLGAHKPHNVDMTDGLMCKHRSFSTGRDSILWPGSGVVFDWHDCEPQCP